MLTHMLVRAGVANFSFNVDEDDRFCLARYVNNRCTPEFVNVERLGPKLEELFSIPSEAMPSSKACCSPAPHQLCAQTSRPHTCPTAPPMFHDAPLKMLSSLSTSCASWPTPARRLLSH